MYERSASKESDQVINIIYKLQIIGNICITIILKNVFYRVMLIFKKLKRIVKTYIIIYIYVFKHTNNNP